MIIYCNVCNKPLAANKVLDVKCCPVCDRSLCIECSPYGICPQHLKNLNLEEGMRGELKRNFHALQLRKWGYFILFLGFFIGIGFVADRFPLRIYKVAFVGLITFVLLVMFWGINLDYRRWYRQTKETLKFIKFNQCSLEKEFEREK